ncbi:hypothetical protein [Cellulomonas carbonis]|uniref:Uncharacterized protein n=1 Tax=Cellulomonas carbonis T26 TaxID=947969 RepID=A0A0A0BLJ3_9CELL|nr:hypothetical protein [Cellulomonas carbonis]KGM09393.1 hypothetical protein N868_02365 [Cellulomonas carbonis T26]GGC04537.1 hypothetical protein GCM10010972_17170 [Cellulomonas carbonis]
MSAAWDVTTEAEVRYRRERLLDAARPRVPARTADRTTGRSTARSTARAAGRIGSTLRAVVRRSTGRGTPAVRPTPLPPHPAGVGRSAAWR